MLQNAPVTATGLQNSDTGGEDNFCSQRIRPQSVSVTQRAWHSIFPRSHSGNLPAHSAAIWNTGVCLRRGPLTWAMVERDCPLPQIETNAASENSEKRPGCPNCSIFMLSVTLGPELLEHSPSCCLSVCSTNNPSNKCVAPNSLF